MTLTVKSHYLTLIREGRKTSTIRLTCRAKPGDRLTFTDYRTSVRTRCVAVESCALGDLTDTHAHADGFCDRDALLQALTTHYPTLSADARTWVVRFERLPDSAQIARATSRS